MTHKKVMFASLILVLAFGLYGCRLPVLDGLTGNFDKMIGVYVVPDLIYGEEGATEAHRSIDERVYAVLTPKTFTHVETGEISESWSYVFEGIPGVALFEPDRMRLDDENYVEIYSDSEGASETHLTYSDEGVLMEGTIYVAPNSAYGIHAYPVYQRKDGQVYLVSSVGWGLDEETSEGIGLTQTYKDESALTINGKPVRKSVEVVVNIGIKYPSKTVSIIQMSAEDTPVSRMEYAAEALPKEVIIGSDTASVIVESKVSTPEGEEIRRELFDRNREGFTAYVLRDGWLCAPEYVRFTWQE